VRYFNGMLFVFTLVFLKCAHYGTDFGTRMLAKAFLWPISIRHLSVFPFDTTQWWEDDIPLSGPLDYLHLLEIYSKIFPKPFLYFSGYLSFPIVFLQKLPLAIV